MLTNNRRCRTSGSPTSGGRAHPPRPKGRHGCCEVGTSPRPDMATRLIVSEEALRVAGWSGELPWATFPGSDPAVSPDLALTSPS